MRFVILSIFIFSIFFFTSAVEAKVLPQAGKSTKTTTSTKSSGITVSPKLRADRKALIVNFGNLQNAKSVSYSLTYKTLVQEEGAIGSLTLGNSQTATQELLFGTCSKNVCRYHTNITGMKLEVTYVTKSGKKYIRKFKIKV